MKKFQKIILVGGTGQIGKALIENFKSITTEIIVITRGENRTVENIRYLNWDGISLTSNQKEFENSDVLINLVGKNVNCRYNEKNKNEIISSRLNSIKAISEVISHCEIQPKFWFQSASATIYIDSKSKPMTEVEGNLGNDFSETVCKKWEACFLEQTKSFSNTKKIILRTSLVLSKEDGVYPRLKKMTQFGLGGKQGNGKQMVSWIHETDLINSINFIIENKLEGVFNTTAPYPITNSEFMKVLRQSIGVKFHLNSPRLLLEIGAFIISTETELILKSRFVIPDNLLKAGFEFKYPSIDKAFNALKNSL